MMMKLYAVRDCVGDVFMPPFMANNNAVAIRSFADACSNDSSPISKHPSDYDLYYIADYNQLSGEITPVERVIISRGTDYAV